MGCRPRINGLKKLHNESKETQRFGQMENPILQGHWSQRRSRPVFEFFGNGTPEMNVSWWKFA
jgi:hypothetical protein